MRTLLLSCLAGVLFLGWLAVWSTTRPPPGHLIVGNAKKELIHIVLGIVLLAAASRVNLEKLRTWMVALIYAVAVGMLILVLLPGVGQTVNGSQRWINLGPLGPVQPSEFAKLSLILLLARIYGPRQRILMRWLGASVLTLLLFALVAKQPDLGTALVLAAIYLGSSFIAGVPLWILGPLVGGACAVLPFALKGYQRDRLLIFLHPNTDPRGLGYHLLQSKLTIGSGGFWGQGLGHGAMTQNGFVPENWTDFVFTVIGEELGLLGCTGLLLLLAGVCLSIAALSMRQPGRTSSLIGVGVFSMLSFQYLVNLSMTVGMAPVVGIPLPFCSYGGSAMLVNLLSVGLALARGRIPKHQNVLSDAFTETDHLDPLNQETI